VFRSIRSGDFQHVIKVLKKNLGSLSSNDTLNCLVSDLAGPSHSRALGSLLHTVTGLGPNVQYTRQSSVRDSKYSAFVPRGCTAMRHSHHQSYSFSLKFLCHNYGARKPCAPSQFPLVTAVPGKQGRKAPPRILFYVSFSARMHTTCRLQDTRCLRGVSSTCDMRIFLLENNTYEAKILCNPSPHYRDRQCIL
jgi:hypothetical protein